MSQNVNYVTALNGNTLDIMQQLILAKMRQTLFCMMLVPILVKISAFKHNFGPICGLQIYNTLLYRIYSPQMGQKLSLTTGIKKIFFGL